MKRSIAFTVIGEVQMSATFFHQHPNHFELVPIGGVMQHGIALVIPVVHVDSPRGQDRADLGDAPRLGCSEELAEVHKRRLSQGHRRGSCLST